MSEKDLMISVSGIRGIVGEALTPDVIVRFAAAFAHSRQGRTVLIGRDSRPSGLVIEQLIAATLMSAGCDVRLLGLCPTPTVGIAVKKHKASGGIVITASHNSSEWNALKLINEKGFFLDEREGQEILDLYESQDFSYVGSESFGSLETYMQANQDHIHHLLPHLPVEEVAGQTFKVALDSVNGAGSEVTPLFLEALGCTVVTQHTDPSKLFPRQPEPIEENLQQVKQWVKSLECDICFVQDPDADRLVIIDSDGTFIGEELTLALAFESVMSDDRYPRGDFVANCSSSLVLDDIAAKHGVTLHRTQVGEVHVTQKMQEISACIGGEGNGGVIFAPSHLGRDSLAGMGLILALIARRKTRLQDIVSGWPTYTFLKKKIAISREDLEDKKHQLAEVFSDATEDCLDGLKYIWPGGRAWLQLRASNTEPFVRIFGESKDDALCRSLMERAEKVLSGSSTSVSNGN